MKTSTLLTAILLAVQAFAPALTNAAISSPFIVSAMVSPSGLVPTSTRMRLEGTVTVATSVPYKRQWQITSNGGATWTDWKFPNSSQNEYWIIEGYGAVISYTQSKTFVCEWSAGDYSASMWDSESKELDTKTYQFRLVARTSDGDYPSSASEGVGQLASSPISTKKFFLDASPSSYSGGLPLRLDASDGQHWFYTSLETENDCPRLYFRVETYNNISWWLNCKLPSTSSSFVIGKNYSECKAYGIESGDSPELGFASQTRKGDTNISGSFIVRELVVDNGGVVMSAAVDFVQYDEGDTNAWNIGQIRFNSDYPIASTPAPPSITNVSGPTCLQVGEEGTWQVKINYPVNTTANVSFYAVWGDEKTPPASPSYVGPNTTSGADDAGKLYHTYNVAGTYHPTFTVINQFNQSAQISVDVVVGSVPLTLKNFQFVGPNADMAEPHFQWEVHGVVKGAYYRIEHSPDLKQWQTFTDSPDFQAPAEDMVMGGVLVPPSDIQFFRVVQVK